MKKPAQADRQKRIKRLHDVVKKYRATAKQAPRDSALRDEAQFIADNLESLAMAIEQNRINELYS